MVAASAREFLDALARAHGEAVGAALVRSGRGASPEFLDVLAGAHPGEFQAASLRSMGRQPPSFFDALIAEQGAAVRKAMVRHDPTLEGRAVTFSQEGEDLLLSRILDGRPPGVFVDVGAHHPFRFSNTYLLYRSGWRGVNIDATPGSMEAFRRFRPEDINIECFVGDTDGERTLVLYNEPALNTGSAAMVASRGFTPDSRYRRVGETTVRVRPLRSLLEEHLPPGARITVMNIDVEGAELDVLRSNDWERFRPEIMLVEQVVDDLDSWLSDETTRFLRTQGYQPKAKAFNTALFWTPREP